MPLEDIFSLGHPVHRQDVVLLNRTDNIKPCQPRERRYVLDAY